jgi:asparagine synthase (glutamine-hydrolysing)
MCGIAGFTGKKNIKLLKNILLTIKHRGPDETIVFANNTVNVGMNRLAIIDLNKKLYPFKYKNYLLLYNGEIYNYKKLKQQLTNKKVKFQTNSDAEVILPLFNQYGPRAFNLLEGMFALFIYDQKNKIIYLARDKIGEKPLYFVHLDNFFAFASELKALFNLPNLNPKLNLSSLSQYFYHGSVFAPQTVIMGINKIPAGHYLEFNSKTNTSSLSRYWSPPMAKRIGPQVKPIHELTNQLDFLLQQSIKSRLVADVPVGCFLSGGVDSSLITYLASQQKKNMHTFSIRFPGFEKYDESDYAKTAAKLCHTKHTEIDCTAEKIRPIITNIGKIIDEPIVDAATLPLYLLAQGAKKKIKVVLTGEGADELFGGYERYYQELIFNQLRYLLQLVPLSLPIIKKIFPHTLRRLKTSIFHHYSSQRIWTEEMLKKLLNMSEQDLYSRRIKTGSLPTSLMLNPLLFMQLTDLGGFLPEQLLMKVDKATMQHSLEARCPYLDSKIIAFALNNFPPSLKVRWLTGKYLLKKVAEKYLPKKIVWRKKHGFSVPLNYWFRHELKDVVYNSLKDVKKYDGLFNSQYYEFIIKNHLGNRKDYADQIWGMIVLTKFMKKHKLTP